MVNEHMFVEETNAYNVAGSTRPQNRSYMWIQTKNWSDELEIQAAAVSLYLKSLYMP